MRIKSQKDFFAGLLYVVIGGGFAIGATNYTVGNAARMGPGYFPLLVGILLGGVPSLGIPSLGVIVGIIVITLVAAKAGPEFNLKEVIILAIILAAGSWVVFIWGLNLQMQVWPSFISG